jgi:hypothetical protein
LIQTVTMGCGSSTLEAPAPTGVDNGHRRAPGDDPADMGKSNAIDRQLERDRQQDELKVKLLLLGAGESGKSTIFKQMRIIYGTPRSEDDLRMYGVVVRSNVVTAVRKLCQLLRSLEVESQLAAEAAADPDDAMTPKEAYDLLRAHLIDGNGPPLEENGQNGETTDWVGHSARAGLGPNNDAKLFLKLWRPIKVLWEVSTRILCLYCKMFVRLVDI